MHDYWNDPPDGPDMPECCGDYMDFDEDTGACRCPRCGRVILPEPDAPDLDLPDVAEELLEAPPAPRVCRHGNRAGECAACDAESDLAYDAERERRGR